MQDDKIVHCVNPYTLFCNNVNLSCLANKIIHAGSSLGRGGEMVKIVSVQG